MWILKGFLLALWLVGFGTLLTLYLAIYRTLPPNTAVSTSVFGLYTVYSGAWWLGVIACVAVSFAVSNVWTGPRSLWLFLAVTDVIPVGLLALFLTLVAKLHAAAKL
jgi:hypothetical protein